MSALAVVTPHDTSSLAPIIRRAADQLASATSAAEVLDARDLARTAYDAAKSAARFARAKSAHDDVIAAVYRAQADALEIEAMAKRRLADEYDAAQERGEIRGSRERTTSSPEAVGVSDLGLTHKDIHEARQIRDAEVAEPGLIRRAIDERLDAGREPTKAALREVVIDAAIQGLRTGGREPAPSRKNPDYQPNPTRDAMARISDYAAQIVTVARTAGRTAILASFYSPDERDLFLKNIAAAIATLGTFMEQTDAE